MIDAGFKLFAERLNPILDVFGECGVRFALEVHPTEIAFDLYTAERALDALDNREEFGFNFDPSHLLWQGVDPVEFIRAFPDRIYHVHIKDAIVTLNGRSGILASHLNFGDPRRGWDFRSPGRGGVNFEEIIRALNAVGYAGPALGRVGRLRHGPRSTAPAKPASSSSKLDFAPSSVAFDAAFAREVIGTSADRRVGVGIRAVRLGNPRYRHRLPTPSAVPLLRRRDDRSACYTGWYADSLDSSRIFGTRGWRCALRWSGKASAGGLAQHTALRDRYAGQLAELASWCDEQGLKHEAAQARAWLRAG